MMRVRRGEAGVTYLEMLATMTIVVIIAALLVPAGRKAYQRRKEAQLQRALTQIRRAIDLYRTYAEEGRATPNGKKIEPKKPPLPTKLEELTEEKAYIGTVTEAKFRAIKAIPRDPMTDSAEWGLRCFEDPPDSNYWCGSNVWDVYSKSSALALDGKTRYREW